MIDLQKIKMMKRLLLVFLILFTFSCNPLLNVSTQGLSYDGTDVYFNGELCAKFSAIELAYDNKKIVREVTFLIVNPKFNDQALPILKLVALKNPIDTITYWKRCSLFSKWKDFIFSFKRFVKTFLFTV